MSTTTRLLAITLPLTLLAGAASAEPKSAQIIQRSMDQMVFRSKGAEMKIAMTLRNRRGETRTRTLYSKSHRQGGLARTLVRFLTPSDVAGTSFLFVEHKDKDDDQYMYLPALKAVKRIAGRQKNARFMGSDFTYADLEWRDLDEATYKKLPDEKIGAANCHVIESIPANKKSRYSKTTSWIRKKDFVLVRIRFFDKRSQLYKVMFVKAVKKVGGSLMATRIKMTDKRKKHSTFLQISDIKLRKDLKSDEFTVRALKK